MIHFRGMVIILHPTTADRKQMCFKCSERVDPLLGMKQDETLQEVSVRNKVKVIMAVTNKNAVNMMSQHAAAGKEHSFSLLLHQQREMFKITSGTRGRVQSHFTLLGRFFL